MTEEGEGTAGACWKQSLDIAQSFGDGYWREQADQREFPRELWRALGEAGLLGVLVPKQFGGREGSARHLVAVAESLASAGLPLLTLITGPGLALPVIARHAAASLRDELLPRLLRGESVVAFAITEGNAGTNLFNLTTRLIPVGDGYKLSGTKNYTSAANVADAIVVVARTAGVSRDEFSLVLLPTDAPGFSCELDDTQVPLPERQCTLRFDDIAINNDQLLGRAGEGLRVLAPALVTERLVSAALSCGIGQYALNKGVARARKREVFAAPLGRHQAVQHALARAAIELRAAQLLLQDACTIADTAARADGAANMACYAAGQAGFAAVDAALQVQGGMGYTRSSGLTMYHQLARLLRSAPVHAESALNAVGEMVLGLPRSY
ncbi:MAG: acyl-CoA dehydrogenase family protein [Nevskiales bacterium]